MPNIVLFHRLILGLMLVSLLSAPALADADALPPGVDPASVGLQPLAAPAPTSTAAPGESRLLRRADGTYQAVPQVRGRTKIFHLVEREAPWQLRPGLTVMAKTYNGVVPGPTLVVAQGDRVVIDVVNDLAIGDTLHLHGVHALSPDMDGVAGISQPLIAPLGGHFRYEFVAARDGTFMYHSHDNEQSVDAGLYGGIIVEPAHPRPSERGIARDDLEILSSWQIQSTTENHFTINGKEYPATQPIEVGRRQRVRIRWINLSGENDHTMHTHGHDQRVIARDASPVAYDDVEDTVLLGPGQRVDVVVTADAQPGTWLVHCHVLDHTEDGHGMPDGLVTAIHYEGTPQRLAAMDQAMREQPVSSAATRPGTRGGLDFWSTTGLGAFAGLTIFLGLPIARARRLSARTVGALNALAIGILVFLVVEIAGNATAPVTRGIESWHRLGAVFPFGPSVALVAGLLIGLVALGSAAHRFMKRAGERGTDRPFALAMFVAVGIGTHNFAEGLAIGASAASGATAIAIGLIVGFALHNATEGFGIAAPLAGRETPPWSYLALAGAVAGGPTFLGTMIGYHFSSATVATLFLGIAAGALVFVIGELWSVLKRSGITAFAASMVGAGFVLGLATEIFTELNGG